MVVVLSSWQCRRSALVMSCVAAESRPVLISSKHSTICNPSSISADVTRFFLPPDTPRRLLSPTTVSLQFLSQRKWGSASTLGRDLRSMPAG
eukprot:3696534-Rhodomonas_salina.1